MKTLTTTTAALLLIAFAPATLAHAGDSSFGGAMDLPIDKPIRGRALPEQPPAPEQSRIDPTEPPPVLIDEVPTFFGEDIGGATDSIIYVIDKSRSMFYKVEPFIGLDGEIMRDPNRFQLATTNLKRSIDALPESFSFNVIFFGSCIEQWKENRQQANAENKAAAYDFIDGRWPSGWTNIGGAVAAALADGGNGSVVLLSDGSPNYLDCTEEFEGDEVVHRDLIQIKNVQKATINTFGVSVDDRARDFLQSIAADHSGSYTEVN